MGVSSLVLTAVGYGVGRFREVRDPSHGLLPVPVGALATGWWVVAVAAVSFMLDVGATVSPLVIRDMVVTVLLSTLLAAPRVRWLAQAAAPGAGGGSVRDAPPPPGAARDGPARPARPRGLMYLDNERRPTLTPQLAFRVAVLGGVALMFFAIIFFRLWYLQVLSGDTYRAEANQNRVREIKVQAPRGEIVDREGDTLVENRTGYAIVARPDKLPEDEGARRALYGRLAKLLDMREARVKRRVEAQLEGAAVLVGDRQAGRARSARGLRARAPRPVPRRGRRARVPAQVPARGDGRAPVRLRRRGEPGGARRRALQRRRAGRPDRQGRDRGAVRPLPARAQRRHARGGRRPRQPDQAAEEGRAGAGPPASPVGRPRRPGGGPAGARGRHGLRRVRGHERAERRGAGTRLGAVLRPRPVHPSRSRSGRSSGSPPRSSASRSTTARSRAAIPPAPRSSS